MDEKWWYKVEINKGKEGTYHHVGSSSVPLDTIAGKVHKGELIRLDELLYMDRGQIKDWAEWDKTLEPSVLIQPSCIISIMQFKGDPRKLITSEPLTSGWRRA